MPAPITGLTQPPAFNAMPSAPASGPAASVSFQDLLLQSVEQVDGMQQAAQTSVERSLIGDDLTMIETFSAVKQADLALRMMLQVRNKLMDAYNEIKQLRM